MGDLYETAQNKNSKISVEISKGRFANGRLMAEDGCSDAHITINKTLSDGVIIEVHFYGQMKEAENTSKKLLGFLSNNVFAKLYYFHAETMRNRFRRLVQIHVVSSQMGRAGGYEIVGNWVETGNNYEMSHLLLNEFDDEKSKLVETLRREVNNHLFKCELDSRYALLGFYVKILGSETTLEELVSRILAERDERICPKSFRKVATSLADLIKIRNEVNEYIKREKDTSTSVRLREEMANFIRTEYVEWLQEFDKCDPIPSSNISVVSLLLIDPSILEMLGQVRERIAHVWGLNVNFELNKNVDHISHSKFIANFQAAWRNFFRSEEKLQRLARVNSKSFYPNGWSDFETRTEEIKTVCNQYVTFFDQLIGLIARVRSAKSMGKLSREKAFTRFYEYYSDLFKFELHLVKSSGGGIGSSQLVDYVSESELLVVEILKSNSISAQLVNIKLDEILAGFKPDSSTRINYLLSLLEFVFSVDEMYNDLNEEAKLVVKNQVFNFLTSVQNKSIDIDRMVTVLVQYLNAYSTTIKKWSIFTPFENIKTSLDKIKLILLWCIEYLLSIADQITDNDRLIIICDLLEEQKNFIVNIDFLPLYVPQTSMLTFIKKKMGSKTTNKLELDEPDKVVEYLDSLKKSKKKKKKDGQLNDDQEEEESNEDFGGREDENSEISKSPARHHSYDLLSQTLEFLRSRIYKFKEMTTSSLDDILSMIGSYFDIVGELVKQLDQQLYANDLDKYVAEKIQLFEYARKFDNLADLNDYLTALKRFIVVTASGKSTMSSSEVISEIAKLNSRSSAEKTTKNLEQLVQDYEKSFKDYRAKFMASADLNQLVAELKGLKNKDQIVRLVAGVAWLQTVNMSKLADRSGRYVESSFELSPSVLHVLECLCLLGCCQDDESRQFSIKSLLLSLKRRVAEIPDDRSKSALVCLLAGIYGLMDFDVTIVCHNEFLVARDTFDMEASYGSMLDKLGSIRFLTLENLIREQIDPTGNPTETPSRLIEQLIYKYSYEPDFGASNQDEASQRDSFILFEEVDTIVSSRLLDDYIEPTQLISSEELAKAVRIVYKAAKQVANRFKVEKKKNRDEKKAILERFQLTVKRSATMAKFEKTVRENESFARFIDTNESTKSIFIEYMSELWTCACQVANLYSDHDRNQEKSRDELRAFLDNKTDEPLFRLGAPNGSTCEVYWKNTWTSNVRVSYLNAFFYLELFAHQSQFITPNPHAYGYMKLSCGPVYSSYLIDRATRHNLVFGLSSCLRNSSEKQRHQHQTESWLLSPTEKSILNERLLVVSDENILFFPSFMSQTVAFDADSEESFRILENRDEWMACICETCDSLSKLDKPVLVFFRNESDLKSAYERLVTREPFLLTNNEISINRFGDRKVYLTFIDIIIQSIFLFE